MICYTAQPHLLSHQWHITLSFTHNSDDPQIIKLPNWVPGSYMIRDFSRYLIQINATCDGKPAQLIQTAKNIWQTPAQRGEYQIHYCLYAGDLSVRGCYLDTQRGFIDGASFFLYLPERCEESHQFQLHNLPENWQVYTSLPALSSHRFESVNYTQLIDAPIEMGAQIEVLEFTARQIPHRIAISGYTPSFDRERLCNDVQRICEATLAMFPQAAPFESYLFLLHVGDNIYGGLEHTSSTALHIDRKSLPAPENSLINNANQYIELLGLISHEYFHAWNVKSIKPDVFIPYKLDNETYTGQLWAFEGITSYYDDLLLVRSGAIAVNDYLNSLAKTLTRIQRTLGRKHQTLFESSFCAWDKFYRQNENPNSSNAIVSYYQQGALMAMCLDLLIRQHSKHSLDNVMQQLYSDWLQSHQGINEQQWQQCAQNVTGLDLSHFFQSALHSTNDLPLQNCLNAFGIELRWLPADRNDWGQLVSEFPDNATVVDLGCRYIQHKDYAELINVSNDSASEQAGLMPKDQIIAINGFKCNNLATQTDYIAGTRLTIHFFRHGVLHQTMLNTQNANADTAFLRIHDYAALAKWLFN